MRSAIRSAMCRVARLLEPLRDQVADDHDRGTQQLR
jgi:hypothetical protein